MVDSQGGWGKPLKKTPTGTNTASTSTTSGAGVSKMTTKSEPFIQKPVLEPIQIIARTKEVLFLVDDKLTDYYSDSSKVICQEPTVSFFSNNGNILAFANAQKIGVLVFSPQNLITYDLPNVLAMHFSRGLGYLVTVDKRQTKHFITIFEATTLKKVLEFETPRYQKETWPILKFVDDDDYAFRSHSSGKIEVLNPKNNFEVIKTIETKPFDFFNVSPKKENLIIVCVNLEKSAGYEKHEGRIDIYEYNSTDPNPSVVKILDKAHEVNLFFSPTGQNLLVWAQTFTDKTGQSYYGEHMLLYLDMPKKVLRRVPTYKGPIHDVAWNPNGQEFIAISGFMPGRSVLFTSQCVPKFEFGHHHRNTIKWSPLSRFVCIGGFGNLSGDMDIWETTTLQKVGSCKSNSAVSCLWSPDGRRILTGVLNPRLRVDNCYKVFKYTGEQLNSVDFSHTELYEVLWRPGNYVDKPCTPVNKNEKKEEEKQKVFRPVGSGSFAAQLKAEKEAKSGGRYLNPDETFGNEPNVEVEEKKEEQPKKKKRIRKKKDKKGNEEAKDDDEGDDEK